MSTKCTIAHDASFHFYHEVLDDDHVYLELRTTHFGAGYGRVMMPIPIHIWETIRHLGAARMDLVDKEDSELMAMVEAEVDQRIARYQDAMREHPDRAGFVRLLGCLPYGAADTPRADQMQSGMQYLQSQRQQQREVRKRISALRRGNALDELVNGSEKIDGYDL
jgi:hypothetical protein